MEEKEYHDCGYSQRKKKNITTVATLNGRKSIWWLWLLLIEHNMTVATPNGRKRISQLWLLPMEETEYDCGYSQRKK